MRGCYRARDAAAMSDTSETTTPQDETATPHQVANVQTQPIQEVQHVRIGAGVGSGPRVQQFPAIATRRHLGRGGDVHDTLHVPREALQLLRERIERGQTDEALAQLDGLIGVVEVEASEEGAQ